MALASLMNEISSMSFALQREDLSFIVSFQWKSANHLQEAVNILLRAHLSNTAGAGAADGPDLLDESEFQQIRLAIACNPLTPPAVLSYLASTGSDEVALRVAENPRAMPETLSALAGHASAEVRAAVAENAAADDQTLELLAADPEADVRFRLAENPRAPERVLRILRDDANPYVGARAGRTLAGVLRGSAVTVVFAAAQRGAVAQRA